MDFNSLRKKFDPELDTLMRDDGFVGISEVEGWANIRHREIYDEGFTQTSLEEAMAAENKGNFYRGFGLRGWIEGYLVGRGYSPKEVDGFIQCAIQRIVNGEVGFLTDETDTA